MTLTRGRGGIHDGVHRGDPHKASHTAVAIDGDERPIARLRGEGGSNAAQRLLAWAEPLGEDRTWAVESAGGLGKLLSQELVAAGGTVAAVTQVRNDTPGTCLLPAKPTKARAAKKPCEPSSARSPRPSTGTWSPTFTAETTVGPGGQGDDS